MPTPPPPPNRVKELFQAALDMPAAERPEFLGRACGADTPLRAEVEALLRLDEAAERERFLSSPDSWPTLAEAAGPSRWVGRRLGPYELQRLVAEGGMGTVYLAERRRDYRQRVAVKVLKGGLLGDEFLARFRAERQALADLQHPHVARLLDGGVTDDGVPFLVMEYVEGLPLDRFCDARQLGLRGRLELFALVCDAVRHAHDRGIVHRDLKPGNVLVTADGTPRVVDFGLAKYYRADPDATRPEAPTRSGAILGTPGYLAPEQGAPGQGVGPAADVYALGAILYHLLTGRPPFRGGTPLETVLQGLRDDPVPPRRLHPGLPRDVETVCLKCLEKEPRKRYADAGALADDLRRFLAGEPIRARPAGPLRRAAKWCGRHPALALLLAFVALAAAAGAAGVAAYLRREAQLRHEAEESEQTARRFQYAAEMNLAWEAWGQDQGERAREILLRLRPRPGQPDLRGFEWRCLWRLCERRLLLRGHDGAVTCVAFSPDGRLLASGSADRRVILWDTATWAERGRLLGNASSVDGLAFSPDGSVLATAGRDGVLRLWDAASGRELAHSEPQGASLNAVAFAPDGKLLATAGDKLFLKLWEPGACREVATLNLGVRYQFSQSAVLECLAFSPDGKTLAAGGWNDNVVRFWDVERRKVRAKLPPAHDDLYFVTFSPDGRTVAVADRADSVRLLEAQTLKEKGLLEGHRGAVLAAAFAPHEPLLATAGADGTVRLWDTEANRERAVLRGHTGRVRALAFSPDGRTVSSGGEDRAVHLHDAATGRPLARTPEDHGDQLRLKMEEGTVFSVAFAPDGGTAAVTAGRELVLLDPATGRERLRCPAAEGRLHAVRFTPDGRTVVTGSGDKTVSLWDAATGERRAVLRDCRNPVYGLALSPDGRLLAAGGGVSGQPGEVVLWDVASRQEVGRLEGHPEVVRAVAFAPDGRVLATGCVDGGVRLWEAATGRLLHELPGHGGGVFALAFSADGRVLASGGADGTVRLWDPGGGVERLALHGHVGTVHAVAFTPDGRSLASGGQDGTVRFWDTTVDRDLATLRPHADRVNALAFSPDGTALISASFDGTACVWFAPPADE